MKTLRIAALSICLALASAVAFSPSNSFADLTKLAATLLSSATWTGTLTQDVTAGSNILFTKTSTGVLGSGGATEILQIGQNTADGTDVARVVISGGATGAPGRGGNCTWYGNDYGVGNQGNLRCGTGDVGASQIQFEMNSTTSALVIKDSNSAVNVSLGGPAAVPTMVSTPVAGTNVIVPGVNIVPTAAANTAALLPATAVPGGWYRVYNSNSANAVRVKAGGTNTMNGATAGGYISVAARSMVDCYTDLVASTNYICSLAVLPTPAGP